MRQRHVAVSAAALIAAASLTPMTAQAADQNTIFVNGGSSACTDSGAGTLAAPFCTIQAASNAAKPGDIVSIAPGTYGATTITNSGTASAPIVFLASSGLVIIGSSADQAALTLAGASNLEFKQITIEAGPNAGALVDGGSGITFAHDNLDVLAMSDPSNTTGLHVTGGASSVTLEDSSAGDIDVVVDGGASGTIITTNRMFSGYEGQGSISVSGASNTAVTSNTLVGCGQQVSIAGSSTGSSIENNVIQTSSDGCRNGTGSSAGVAVDPSSAASTTLDYNDVYSSGAVYLWNGAAYSTASALDAATGQGAHDYNGADGALVGEGSPIINSANSAAIGEQPTDEQGDPRTLDPLVKPTGAGPFDDYDRGAIQFQDPGTTVAGSTFTASATQVPAGAAFTVSAKLADTWGDPNSSYEFFSPDGAVTPVYTSTGTASMTIASPGLYDLDAAIGAAGSSSYVQLLTGISPQIKVVAPKPLTADESAIVWGPLNVTASDGGTTDAWNLTGFTVDFGDGSAPVTSSTTNELFHTYAKPGTYSVTETVADAGGNKATKTIQVSTLAKSIPAPTSTLFERDSNGDQVEEWMGAQNGGWQMIGNNSSALYAGGAGVFAVTPGGSAIYKYDSAPYAWTRVGGAGAQFVVSGDALYALTPKHSAVMRFDGTAWTSVGGPAQNIYAAADGVFATNPGGASIYRYKPSAKSWTRAGGGYAQYATSGDSLYGLGSNGSDVAQWSGTGTEWSRIGGAADKLYAGGFGLFATNPSDTAIYQYNPGTKGWTRIGGGGVEFTVSQTDIYGQSSVNGPAFAYNGTPGSWTYIGGGPTTIVGG